MSDRREATRFELVNGPDAEIRVLRDVVIEHMTERELKVLARNASLEGEELTMHVRSDEGEVMLNVRTVATQPVVIDGRIRHRLFLQILAAIQNDLVEASGR
jgi:uncharacterized protein YqeY